jgi:hypothetical protein
MNVQGRLEEEHLKAEKAGRHCQSPLISERRRRLGSSRR